MLESSELRLAELLADFDACATEGALYNDSQGLSILLNRPTTSWKGNDFSFIGRLRIALCE